LKLYPVLIGLFLLIGICLQTYVLAQVSVGVKDGDWIEYNMIYSGSTPSDYPEWMKIEVLNVEGTSITAELSLLLLDGTTDTVSGTYDLETGVLDLLLIPAGLDSGDEYFHPFFGNIVIAGTEEYSFGDAKRVVSFATVDGIEFQWDKTTGIILQSEHSTSNFAQKMIADKTNMWEPQILGIDSTILYILIIAIMVIIAILVVFMFKKR